MPDLLVSKPQFDTAKLTPGTAVFVKGTGDRNTFYNFSANCLITKATPLELTICYVGAVNRYEKNDEGSDATIKTTTLPIGLVANELVKIELLERTVNKT